MKKFDPLNGNLTHYLFCTGKGGVGKTSIASATALQLVDNGYKVAMVSTDPASNLQDVFEMKLPNKLTAVEKAPGLFLANFDPVTAANEYKESVLRPYKNVLPESALKNMEEQLSGSCTVEVAAFNEFAHFLTDEKVDNEFDYIIFDTAPTGHTIRMLQLPSAWNNYLDENDRGVSCLGQLSGLSDKKEMYEKAVQTLTDDSLTTLLLVTRPQRTSLKETIRSSGELSDIGMKNQKIIVNGTILDFDDEASKSIYEHQQADLSEFSDFLNSSPFFEVPLRSYNISSLENIRLVLNDVQPENKDVDLPDDDFPSINTIVDNLIDTKKKLVFTMGKGGVGKTTVAVQIANQMAERGKTVRLITTDPADHLSYFNIDDKNINVNHINEKTALLDYQTEVLDDAKKAMDTDDVDYIAEDLRSPCTQEIAVFREFANLIADNEDDVVVVDTAPTGHTLLLLDSTQRYAAEIKRTSGEIPQSMIELLPKLQDPEQTEIVMVTLPEPTPVYESMRLNDDLNRAKIAHTWWIVNQSFFATKTSNKFLKVRAKDEIEWIEKVKSISNGHFAVEKWNPNFEKDLLKI
ncbi:arsenical pump-driving ATPase [Companilactobacillus mishanensis]|uniref:Arsenical pump-driving ATPase n=1 Tax=Companilactobacillus mishanensis TaxID=2486008 RepID=A0A5P0ZJS1_9LACO|nr:arsenical pump-driving ATPase [Companilactobacillus mishanensis]MQS53340.1 arsenical pump-driving ATPase [Companilactobacillus mishanensis]